MIGRNNGSEKDATKSIGSSWVGVEIEAIVYKQALIQPGDSQTEQ